MKLLRNALPQAVVARLSNIYAFEWSGLGELRLQAHEFMETITMPGCIFAVLLCIITGCC
jgi:hypothetical protein